MWQVDVWILPPTGNDLPSRKHGHASGETQPPWPLQTRPRGQGVQVSTEFPWTSGHVKIIVTAEEGGCGGRSGCGCGGGAGKSEMKLISGMCVYFI